MTDRALTGRVWPSVGAIAQPVWDNLAGDDNPFTSHAFLTALEDSGSVGEGTGWLPAPLALENDAGEMLAVMPSYLKQHSQGEYVFDHGWADAWHHAGGEYYPKLQIAAPFTPATGPRLLTRDPALAVPLLRAAEQLAQANGWSSGHATFVTPKEAELFDSAGWLRREDIQFHWLNRGYGSFDDFLADLTSRKRKALRKERAAANEGLDIRVLRGSQITSEDWDAFWLFYQDTGARKWGSPYLTRAAFDLFAERLGDKVMLMLACDGARPIAGALNFVGSDTLFGRYWGCSEHRPFLHFELCYYRAIEQAIALGLDRVEAGAQGGHKLARGYVPIATLSYHYIVDPGFRAAVKEFLGRERRELEFGREQLGARTPFRKG